MEGEKKSAIMKLAAAMLIFGSIGIFRRYIPLSSAWMACVRGIIGTLFIAVYSPMLNIMTTLV